jgi:hypothetical protein
VDTSRPDSEHLAAVPQSHRGTAAVSGSTDTQSAVGAVTDGGQQPQGFRTPAVQARPSAADTGTAAVSAANPRLAGW